MPLKLSLFGFVLVHHVKSQTCGDVRLAFQSSGCCGAPDNTNAGCFSNSVAGEGDEHRFLAIKEQVDAAYSADLFASPSDVVYMTREEVIALDGAGDPDNFWERDVSPSGYASLPDTKAPVGGAYLWHNCRNHTVSRGLRRASEGVQATTKDKFYTASVAKTLPVLMWLTMKHNGLISTLNMPLSDIFPKFGSIRKMVKVDGDVKPLERAPTVLDVLSESFAVYGAAYDWAYAGMWGEVNAQSMFPHMDLFKDSILSAAESGDLEKRAEEIMQRELASMEQQNVTLYFAKQPGDLAYMSSEWFAAAAIEKVYNDALGLSGPNRMSFEEIFHANIASKIGAEFVFHATSKNDPRVATLADTYIKFEDRFVHDTFADGKAHRSFSLIAPHYNMTGRFCYTAAYAAATLEDMAKLMQIVVQNGAYDHCDGTRTQFVDASDMRYLQVPSVSSKEEMDSSYYGPKRYSMGGIVVDTNRLQSSFPDYPRGVGGLGLSSYPSFMMEGAFGIDIYGSIAHNVVLATHWGARSTVPGEDRRDQLFRNIVNHLSV